MEKYALLYWQFARIVLQRSVEDQVSHCIELHVRDHAADELQENEQGEVGFDLVSAFRHGVRHGLEDGRMSAWMDSWHHNSFQKGEFLHRESLIEVLSLDVETNIFVGDWHSILSGTEVHSWSMVVLIIDNVHLIVTVIFKLLLFLFKPSALQHHNLIISFLDDLIFRLFFLNLQARVEPSPADHLLQQQVLLILVEILAHQLLFLRRLPLPTIANLDQMISCTFKLIRRQLSSLLEHILLRRRYQLLHNFLPLLVKLILPPVNPTLHQEQIIS